jgi:hypothetical protein
VPPVAVLLSDDVQVVSAASYDSLTFTIRWIFGETSWISFGECQNFLSIRTINAPPLPSTVAISEGIFQAGIPSLLHQEFRTADRVEGFMMPFWRSRNILGLHFWTRFDMEFECWSMVPIFELVENCMTAILTILAGICTTLDPFKKIRLILSSKRHCDSSGQRRGVHCA